MTPPEYGVSTNIGQNLKLKFEDLSVIFLIFAYFCEIMNGYKMHFSWMLNKN